MDTKFYLPHPVEHQEDFFWNMCNTFTGYSSGGICFNRGEPRDKRDEEQKVYHIGDATVYVNRKEKTTITARTDKKILAAKSKIEEMVGIKLMEFDPLKE